MQQVKAARRVLTIDDNDAIHGDFRKILTRDSAPSKLSGAKAMLFGDAKPSAAPDKFVFEVESALQGEEGLRRLQEGLREGRPFSLAFVDMRMPPGWDGLQTIQRLWEADPDLQVVICSAYSDYSWDDISKTLGLTDRLLILKKPFDPAEVSQLAIALSEKWSLRREAKLKMEELEAMVQARTIALTHQALHDKLTGLGNRTLFTDSLERAVQKAIQQADYRFAVLFLDFDRFKMINDSLGHETGDLVLKEIAGRLTGAIKLAGPVVGNAVTARLGGDEFTILIDNTGSGYDPNSFGSALLNILSGPYKLDGRELVCTASIGLTTSELNYQHGEHALRDADTAMYHAKAAGKARYVMFDRRMHEEVTRRLEMENDLRHVLERDELTLYYQPIVSLKTGALDGFETLVRWKHPKRGMVPPLEFIPCCEEMGLIVPIGLWILTRACEQLQAWKTKYPELRELTMAVNLSARQLSAPMLVEQVAAVIKNTAITPSCLVLEITESVMISDPNAADILHQLRALGVRLHLDDFGTGYSSLSSLHQFPLNGLKMDRSFMKNLAERRDYMAVVQAIISLARHLGMTLIAEGIETMDQIPLLQSMDCDLAQGYFFHKPGDAATAESIILDHLSGKAMAA